MWMRGSCDVIITVTVKVNDGVGIDLGVQGLRLAGVTQIDVVAESEVQLVE